MSFIVCRPGSAQIDGQVSVQRLQALHKGDCHGLKALGVTAGILGTGG